MPMEDMKAFLVPGQLDGTACDTFLFQRWSGYSHPVRPIGPITYRAALAKKGFCRAYLGPKSEGGLILRVKCVGYQRSAIALSAPVRAHRGDERYYAVESVGESVRAGKELTAFEAIESAEFLRVVFSDGDETFSGERVKVKDWYLFDYQYDRDVLRRVIVDNGTRREEFENDPGK
jgi:hypothetical protein